MNKLVRVVMSASILMLVSCEKTEVTQKSSEESLKAASGGVIESNLQYSSAVAMEGIASIKYQAGRIPPNDRPKKGYKAPDLGDLTVEEVIYYLEATHNFDAPNDAVREQGVRQRFNFSMPLIAPGENKINQDELVLIYDGLFDDIITEAPANMQVYMVNVYGLSIGELDVEFEMDVHYTGLPASTVTPLDAGDDWYAFNGQGKCPGGGNRDAADRLESLVNWYGVTGWAGSTGSSTGASALVCVNNAMPPSSYTNVAFYPSNNTYVSNGNSSQWPVTDCSSTFCLTDLDMEDNLVSFFNYTNNTVLSGPYADHTMMLATYEDAIFTPPFQGYCYLPGPNGFQHRHRVQWEIGKPVCETSLPW